MASAGGDKSASSNKENENEKESTGISDKVVKEVDEAYKKSGIPDKMASAAGDKSTSSNKENEKEKKSTGISDKVVKELDEAYKKSGIPGITERVKASLNEWKTVPINIAITGNSGVGKSSYINALFGVSADDERAAPVGVVETTTSPKSFTHPENENLKLWDLPGVGTPNFPKENYLEKVNFRRYDFFLVFAANRFTSNDIWLAQQIRHLKRKFYFIRTKVDLEISDDRNAHPNTHSRSQVLQNVRRDCIDQLKNQEFAKPEVFIISNFVTNEFDFARLSECLIRDAPDMKREALTLSLTTLTEEIIRAKERYLKNRIYYVSIASAAAAAVPIPGVGFSVDIATLLEESLFYRKQLRLDDSSVQENATALNVSVEELRKRFKLQSQLISYTARGLLAFFGSLGVSNLTENVLKVSLPVIGCLIAAGMAYGVQVTCLKKLLHTMVNDALTINAEMNIVFAKNAVEAIER